MVPDGLVLYNPSGSIVDAIAWEAAGDMATADPGPPITTTGLTTAPEYLHVTVDDDLVDNSLQAPNDVLGDTGGAWANQVSTEGALNLNQASGSVIMSAAPPVDTDGDGFTDDIDNCPTVFNPLQTDSDSDGIGNDCDDDDDNDGVLDASDNCPVTANTGQEDLDLDGTGDLCDFDRDGDGIENDNDNCPDLANPLQADQDGDGIGDDCDPDIDGDGVLNASDNCPTVFNNLQENLDMDSLGDACDSDIDGDGIINTSDNCPTVVNPGQEDVNNNGIGDACESDADMDGVPDELDNCPDTPNMDQADVDLDGIGDACDTCVGIEVAATNLVENFNAGSLPTGWTHLDNIGDGAIWRFDDPRFRGNLTGGSGDFAILDSRFYSQDDVDAELRTPVVDLTNTLSVELEFKTDFNWRSSGQDEIVDVDVSVNGSSGPWNNVWRKELADYRGPVTETVDITSIAANQSSVMIRFRYYNGKRERWWEVDDVIVRSLLCDVTLDTDGDGVPNTSDNCITVSNPLQEDLDADGIGDACDDDRDADGIPDAWELAHGLNISTNDAAQNPDGDVFTNYDEYRADTDPLSNTSYLSLTNVQCVAVQTNVYVYFSGSTNREYDVLYNDGSLLNTNDWYLGTATPFWGAGIGTLHIDTNILTQPSIPTRYYRLRVIDP